MPDILTHIAFADDILNQMPAKKLKKEIEKRRTLFRLGAQGPDIFYYHQFIKGKNDPIKQTGGMLHTEKTGDFLKRSFDYCVEQFEEKDNYYNLISYISGFLCHYVLDKNAHPFIYRFSGYSFDRGKDKGKYSWQHKVMESYLDVYIWHLKKDKQAYKEKVYKLIHLKQMPNIIKIFLEEIINTIYSKSLTKENITCAYEDMQKAFKLLYDPVGIKKYIINKLEWLLRKEITMGKPFYAFNIEASRIYLNLNKDAWAYPLDSDVVLCLSFLEIYDRSVAECTLMLKQILEHVQHKEKINPDILGDRSYLTNLKWNSEKNLKKEEALGLLQKRRL